MFGFAVEDGAGDVTAQLAEVVEVARRLGAEVDPSSVEVERFDGMTWVTLREVR